MQDPPPNFKYLAINALQSLGLGHLEGDERFAALEVLATLFVAGCAFGQSIEKDAEAVFFDMRTGDIKNVSEQQVRRLEAVAAMVQANKVKGH